MSVVRGLFRLYRPVVFWFAVNLILLEVAATGGVVLFGPVASTSLWLLTAGTATKYGLLVVGVMLVVNHLRQFVSNGATRREFLLAAAALGLVLSAATAILIPLGH